MFRVLFIGGPLNNQLLDVPNLPPILSQYPHSVCYYPDGQLRTGVPVYSCLWGPGNVQRCQIRRAEKPPARQE